MDVFDQCDFKKVLGGNIPNDYGDNGDLGEFGCAPTSFAGDELVAGSIAAHYEGLDDALSVVKTGGFYVIDDLLPQPNWPEDHAAKVPVLIEQLAANPRFAILPLVWASGVVVAVRRRTGDPA